MRQVSQCTARIFTPVQLLRQSLTLPVLLYIYSTAYCIILFRYTCTCTRPEHGFTTYTNSKAAYMPCR